MTEERRLPADLRAKAGDGDFLRSVTEAVLQMLMAEGGPWPAPWPVGGRDLLGGVPEEPCAPRPEGREARRLRCP
jgi:hypothetical protein